MLPGRKGTAEEVGDLPTWLCAGGAPTTALGQASGLGVVTPARPAAGTAGTRGILQLCLLRLFQALCATCALLFWGRPLIVLDVVCFFYLLLALLSGCAFACHPGDRETHIIPTPRLWCLGSCSLPCQLEHVRSGSCGNGLQGTSGRQGSKSSLSAS